MNNPGVGQNGKKKIVDCGYKFPPKRTAREWREICRTKIQQLEAIQYTYMGRTSIFTGSGE